MRCPDCGGERRIFFIAPSASYTIDGRAHIASDENDGLHPERALLTINRFVALATANVGDVGKLLPGTHTMSAIDKKPGLTLVGADTMYDISLCPPCLSRLIALEDKSNGKL